MTLGLELVVNGGFDVPDVLDGWSVGSNEWVWNSGRAMVQMSSGFMVQTILGLTIGGIYRLSFDYESGPNGGGYDFKYGVGVGIGTNIITLSGGDISVTHIEHDFVISINDFDGMNIYVGFVDDGSSSLFIDNVSFRELINSPSPSPSPEPIYSQPTHPLAFPIGRKRRSL